MDIDYSHRPEFGIPSAERAGLDTSLSRPALLERYEKERLLHRKTELRELAAEMTETPSVLVCMERELCDCHRGQLAKELSRLTGLAIFDLGQSD